MPEDQVPSFSEQEVQQHFERIGREFVEKELHAEAIEEYKDLLRTYPGSRWAANALMGIAECFHHMGQTDEELRTLEAIAEQFPDHIVAKRAQAAIRLLRGSEPGRQPVSPEATTASGFSRQASRLRLSLMRYSLVGWAMSGLLLILIVVLWVRVSQVDRGTRKAVADMSRRLGHMQIRIDTLDAIPPPGPPEPAQPAPGLSEPPPPPEVLPPPVSDLRTYTVKPGDTLWVIAKRQLGDARRLKEIAELNGLKEPYRLQVGDELKLPAR